MIEDRRKELGLTQAACGRAIGFQGSGADQGWRRLVTGAVGADVAAVAAVADLLGLPFEAARAALDEARLTFLASRRGRSARGSHPAGGAPVDGSAVPLTPTRPVIDGAVDG